MSHDPHMTCTYIQSHHRLTQLEDILRTYVMYNFDLGEYSRDYYQTNKQTSVFTPQAMYKV